MCKLADYATTLLDDYEEAYSDYATRARAAEARGNWTKAKMYWSFAKEAESKFQREMRFMTLRAAV